MSDTPVQKKVDESWKEQVEQEKHHATPAPTSAAVSPTPPAPPPAEQRAPSGAPAPADAHAHAPETLEARFDLFISSLAMEALIALGDTPHPATRKTATSLPQARYVIDLLGVLADKTKGNLSVDEERMLKDVLYQLRMRYLSKSGGAAGT